MANEGKGRRSKCEIRDGAFVEPCWCLEDMVDGLHTGKRKGVNRVLLYNKAGPSRSWYSLRSGKHSRDGVSLNFCPFCGEAISGPFQRDGALADISGESQ